MPVRVPPSIAASPNPANVGTLVTISWAGDKARRVRIEWSSGNQFITASGPGSAKITVPIGGETPVVLMSGRYELARTVLSVPGVVVIPPPPDPPPPDPTVPTVIAVSPADGSSDQSTGVNVTATFSEDMDPATITTTTCRLRDPALNVVPAAVSYDAGLRQVTINPTSALLNATAYSPLIQAACTSLAGVPMAAGFVWTFSTVATAPGPSVVNPARLGGSSQASPTLSLPPTGLVISGYGSATVGGDGGTLYNVNTWADFKTRVQQSGPRIVMPYGTANFEGNGETAIADDPFLTVDGTNFTGSIKRAGMRLNTNQIKFTQMRMRPGDQVASADDVDALTINPGAGGGLFLDNVVVDHCSLLWGPDMGGLGVLNGSRNVTVQHSIMGCGLYLSAHSEGTVAANGHSFGVNISQNASAVEHGDRITLYRNVILLSTDRNPQSHDADHLDVVNNVIYGWEKFCPRMNPLGCNFEANMLKIGPNTTNHEAVMMTYALAPIHTNVVWLGDSTTPGGTNLCVNFAPDNELNAGVRRTAGRYGASISVTPATANMALFANVVATAGPTARDSIDASLMAHVTNGTAPGNPADGTGGLYNGTFGNGVGSPPPHPSWPAPF